MFQKPTNRIHFLDGNGLHEGNIDLTMPDTLQDFGAPEAQEIAGLPEALSYPPPTLPPSPPLPPSTNTLVSASPFLCRRPSFTVTEAGRPSFPRDLGPAAFLEKVALSLHAFPVANPPRALASGSLHVLASSSFHAPGTNGWF